jgi:hypothetical protein
MWLFWDLRGLKQRLVAQSVTDRESLAYLLCLGGAAFAALYTRDATQSVWNQVFFATSAAAFLIGTVYVYLRNGGGEGRDFLVRYVSLSWIFGVRFNLLVSLPVLVALFSAERAMLARNAGETTPAEVAGMAILNMVFYIRLGQHFRDIRT